MELGGPFPGSFFKVNPRMGTNVELIHTQNIRIQLKIKQRGLGFKNGHVRTMFTVFGVH